MEVIMDGFVLWLIGMLFTWGILYNIYNRWELYWNMALAIVYWPFLLAKLLVHKSK
jgi:hypothetical protein